MRCFIFVTRVQIAVGLCVSPVVWQSLPRIHSMGRPGQACIQSGGPKWTGASLGTPQGLCSSVQRNKPAKNGEENSIFTVVLNWKISYYSAETIWLMRSCPVLCGTTTSWTSSKKSEDKNCSSGLSPLLLSFPPPFHYRNKHINSSIFLWRFLKLPKRSNLHAQSKIHEDSLDENLQDPSPPHNLTEDHFEVSPDHASPQPPP